MRTRNLLVLIFVALIAAFIALNWSAVTTPTLLSLGITTFDAPLGLVMLSLLVALTIAFLTQLALWQGSALLEVRRHNKEMQTQRVLADQAEASRFTELRGAMASDFEKVGALVLQSRAALRLEMQESSNSLAAMIGEVDDRLKRSDSHAITPMPAEPPRP